MSMNANPASRQRQTPLALATPNVPEPDWPALLQEEIYAWVRREQAEHSEASTVELLTRLAQALGLKHPKQIYRYMSGETPLGLDKFLPFCRMVGSTRLPEALLERLEETPLPALQGMDLAQTAQSQVAHISSACAEILELLSRPRSREGLQRVYRLAQNGILALRLLVQLYEQRR